MVAFIEAALRRRQAQEQPLKEKRIPPERRTVPMTLKRAAQLLGYTDYHGEKNGAEILSKSIREGTVIAEKLNRQRYVFDRHDFPAESHLKITPKA
jgi:hypothetical protein